MRSASSTTEAPGSARGCTTAMSVRESPSTSATSGTGSPAVSRPLAPWRTPRAGERPVGAEGEELVVVVADRPRGRLAALLGNEPRRGPGRGRADARSRLPRPRRRRDPRRAQRGDHDLGLAVAVDVADHGRAEVRRARPRPRDRRRRRLSSRGRAARSRPRPRPRSARRGRGRPRRGPARRHREGDRPARLLEAEGVEDVQGGRAVADGEDEHLEGAVAVEVGGGQARRVSRRRPGRPTAAASRRARGGAGRKSPAVGPSARTISFPPSPSRSATRRRWRPSLLTPRLRSGTSTGKAPPTGRAVRPPGLQPSRARAEGRGHREHLEARRAVEVLDHRHRAHEAVPRRGGEGPRRAVRAPRPEEARVRDEDLVARPRRREGRWRSGGARRGREAPRRR